MRVLLIGATGQFGRRLAVMLAELNGLELTLAARGERRLRELAGELNAGVHVLDRNLPLGPQVSEVPNLLIDASGPFQSYGDMHVVDYALEIGANYFDLADAAAFVERVLARDAEAAAAGVALVSGLSTYPAISQAALSEIAQGRPVTHIQAGIAPSPATDIGRGVMGAIAAQSGEATVPMREAGRLSRIAGLTATRRMRVAPPGGEPMRTLNFAVVEAPDAVVTDIPDVWTGAATRPQALQAALVMLARLRGRKLLPRLQALAGPMHRTQVLNRLRVARRERRGGMVVEAHGKDWEGSWHLIAEDPDGPNIPAIPAASTVRQMLAGRTLPLGARSGNRAFGEPLTLAEMEPEFARFAITHSVRRSDPDLYPELMGDRYDALHAPIRELHRTGERSTFRGRCDIRRGHNPLGWLVCAVFRFPPAGEDVPLSMEIRRDSAREMWRRDFDGHVMRSSQEAAEGIILERFGPFGIWLAPLEQDGEMHLSPQGWQVFGIGLPRVLAPGGVVFETVDGEGRFQFNVDIRAPLIGRLVYYKGWLERVE